MDNPRTSKAIRTDAQFQSSDDQLLNLEGILHDSGDFTELDDKILSQSLDIKPWLKPAKEQASPPPTTEVVHRTEGKRQSFVARLFKKITNKVNNTVTLEVLDVVNLCLENDKQFWGGWLDCPQSGNTINGYVIYISGWVIGKKAKVTHIQVSIQSKIIAEVPVNVPRPGVPETYFFLEDILVCGYADTIYLIEQPIEGRLELKAVFDDGEISPVASINYCKY